MAPLYFMPNPSQPSTGPATPQHRILGSGKDSGELPPIECTYPDCQLRFASIKDMRRHKRYCAEHDYCRRCDVDCHSWEELLKHKVDLMTVWMYDDSLRRSDEGQKGPKHIVCEFCGVDFETFDGRDLHRQQMHKAEQNIACPGCDERFCRASELIHHLEAGECLQISRDEFQRAVTTKHILKQIMENPAEFQENMSNNKGVIERLAPPAGYLTEGSSDRTIRDSDNGDDESVRDGGVSLVGVDQDLLGDAGEKLGTWPRLPPKDTQFLSDSIESMSLRSHAGSVVESEISAVTQRRAGMSKHYDNAFPALGSASNAPSSTASTRSATSKQPSAWTTPGKSLTVYRGGESVTSQTMTRTYNNATDNFDHTSNLLYHRFWDAGTRDFDGDMFFNVVIERYCCPFPGCQAEFEEEMGIQSHLQSFHVTKKWRCPGTTCMKLFSSATALVAHTEMSNKCMARRNQGYKAAIDEITGGFLKVKQVQVARLVDTNQALVVNGQPASGVTDVKFAAKRPDQHYE